MTETRVNTTTANAQTTAAIAANSNGDTVVAWRSFDGTGWNIHAQRFNAAGVAQGPELQVNSSPGLSLDAPRVAIDASGNFAVAWSDPDGLLTTLRLQRFDALGTPVGTEADLGQAPNPITSSSIARNASGNLVVVWTESYFNNDTSQTEEAVYVQRYDASLQAQGSKQQVNVATGTKTYGRVAMAADGSFVVVWMADDGQDGDGSGIYGRLYDASGVSLDGEFLVNMTTTGGQLVPSVAMAANGAFVVAWQSLDSDGSGIFAQRFGASGLALGTQFAVNTTVAGWQQTPAVAMDSTGRFMVAWTSYLAQDGSGAGVYGQWYATDGSALGSETLINTTTIADQEFASVAMRSDGTAVVAWESNDQDGSGRNVYLDSSTAPVCFLRGTLILTARGEVAVEQLRAGDLVATRFGGLRPIRWIGTQRFHPRFAGPTNTPVRFAPGSLGQGIPSTALLVSPGHAMLVGDVLAHAGALVNGTTITQPRFQGDSIDYFHLDLGPHDCVLANSAWAESYFEDRNRDSFHNAADFHARFPGHEPVRQATCLPIVTAGHPEIAALRETLPPPRGRWAA